MSFLFGIVVAIKLLTGGETFLGVTLALIASMQLLECLLWIFLGNDLANGVLTVLVWALVTLQPILMSYYATEDPKGERVPEWATILNWVVLGIFGLFMVSKIGIGTYRQGGLSLTTQSRRTCKLEWGSTEGFHWTVNVPIWIGFVSGYTYALCATKNYDIYALSVAALVIAVVFSYRSGLNPFDGNRPLGSFESVWCFAVNLIAAYVVLLRMPDGPVRDSLF